MGINGEGVRKMKIIKNNFEKKITCPECGSEFIYNQRDDANFEARVYYGPVKCDDGVIRIGKYEDCRYTLKCPCCDQTFEIKGRQAMDMKYRYNVADYDALISKSKYSKRIAEILYEKESLNQDELRIALKIKPNNLSNVIRKIEPFDILFIRKYGENVYYSLSPKGCEFFEYLRKEKQNESNNEKH